MINRTSIEHEHFQLGRTRPLLGFYFLDQLKVFNVPIGMPLLQGLLPWVK